MYEPLDHLPSAVGIVYGVLVPKPLKTDLPGRIRLKLRNDDVAFAFIRSETSTRKFHIANFGDHWELCWEIASNVRLSNRG